MLLIQAYIEWGGLYFTWDSDSYGTNTHHSIRSTYGDSYSDNITLNSFNHIRFNIDANNNNGTSYFELGDNTTGTGNIIFRIETGGDIALNGKHAFRSNDSWLRLNQNNAFSSGTYTPGFLRVDGGITSGGSGSPGAGQIRATGLAGGGNRLVLTDNNGTLTPSTSLAGTGLGDNLGNHLGTSTLNMQNNVVTGVTDFYLSNWVRHSDNDGTYWSNNAWHIYPRNGDDMNIRTGNTGSGGLALMNGGNTRGYLHWTADWQGWLNSGRQWQLRTRNNDGYSPNLYFDEEGNESWSGDPGADEGKIEYHSNRFYIASGNNSTEIARFRRSGGDQIMISNSGDVYNYNGWFRPHSDRGIYFESYGGGWHMTDGTWVRAYNGKYIWTAGWSQADQGMNAPVYNFGQWNNGLPGFVDGQFYRTGGQAELRVDDWFYIRDNSGTIRHQFNTDLGEITLGPNTGWGRYLRLGGNGNNTGEANIATTNGNLHIDSRSGSHIYLNYYNRDWVNVGDPGSTGYLRVGGFHIYDNNDWAYHTGAPNDRVYFENRIAVRGAIQISHNPYGWTDVRCTNCNDAINGNPNLWFTAQDRIYLAARNATYAVEFSVYDAVNGTNDRAFYPSSANWGRVGRSDYYFYEMYSRYYNAANGYYYFSDHRLKENVQTLDGALAQIQKLRGVSYDMKSNSKYFNDKDIESNYGRIGFIAQEVQEVLPGAVRVVDSDSDDYPDLLAVDYTMAVPLLVEAVKEQQKMIEALGGGTVRTIEDFGSERMDGEYVWVSFNNEFSIQLMNGEVPVVSVTPNELGAEIAVIEKTSTGFKVRKVGTNPLTFDWIAKARVTRKSITATNQSSKTSPISVEERQVIEDYWKTKRAEEFEESQRVVKESEARAKNYSPTPIHTPGPLNNVQDPEGTGPRIDSPATETPEDLPEVPFAEPVDYESLPSLNVETEKNSVKSNEASAKASSPTVPLDDSQIPSAESTDKPQESFGQGSD